MISNRRVVAAVGLLTASAFTACGQPNVETFDAASLADAAVDAGTPSDDGLTTDVNTADQTSADAASPVDAAGDATSTQDAGATTCTADKDCPTSAPLCNVVQGVCVACKYTAHCPGPYGRCVDGSCLAPKACVSDKDCTADAAVCDSATKHCADCINHDDCSKGQVCKINQCLPTPLDCKSSKDCAALNQVCTSTGSCADCISHSDCDAKSACNQGLCVPAVCKPGEGKCTGPIKREVCKADGSGWESSTCPSQTGCEAGECKKQICNPGQKKCDGDSASVCSDSGLAWVSTPCKAGEVCVAGACTTKICKAGTTQCTSDGKLQTCAPDEKSWKTTPCAKGEACGDGTCKQYLCEPTKPYCDKEKRMICGPLGLTVKLDKDCATAKSICAEGACAPTSCKAGDKLCKGQDVAVCQADGKTWKVSACPDSDGNKCTEEACETATHSCKSGKPNTCDDGNSCTTGTCNGFTGACKQAPKSGSCDDGNGCTSGDLCAAGKCVKGGENVLIWSGQKGPGYSDGPIAVARYSNPYDIDRSDNGSLIVADTSNRRIRRISTSGVVETVAGSGEYGDLNGPALNASFRSPVSVAAGKGEWVYVADVAAHRIRLVNSVGTVSTYAGSGGMADTDGPAAVAQFYGPDSIAVDSKNNVWVGESTRHRIRRISAAGMVSSPLGSGVKGFLDGVGSNAKLSFPYDVAIGPKGMIWFVDGSNHRIRSFDPVKNIVTTKIGTGTAGFLDGPATKALTSSPRALRFGPEGRLWFYDFGNRLLRRLEADGKVTTVMGKKGVFGVVDGVLGVATLSDVRGFTFDHTGALVLASLSSNRLRRIARTVKFCDDRSPCTTDSCDVKTGKCVYKPEKTGTSCDDGSVCTTKEACDAKGKCTGTMKKCADANVCTNDGCNPYTGACMNAPASQACDDGDACTPADFCVDGTCKSDVGRILTVAGNGSKVSALGKGATVSFNRPYGLVRSKSGEFFLSERDGNRLTKVSADGTASPFAGTGSAGFLDGPGTKAKFNQPTGLAADPFGSLYVADSANHRIRIVNAKGVVNTLAGSGTAGFADGKATVAKFNTTLGLDIDSKGMVWVADSKNHRLRRIDTSGVVTTISGDGQAGFSDGVGKYVRFHTPSDVLALQDGSVLVADSNNHRVRQVCLRAKRPPGAGMGGGGTADGPRLGVRLLAPTGLTESVDGTIYISSINQSDIRSVDASGLVERVIGKTSGFRDGLLTTARLYGPSAVVAASSASLFIVDSQNNRLRQLLRSRVLCKDAAACAPSLCDAKTGKCAVKTIAEGGACVPGKCKTAGICKSNVCTGGVANSCDDKKPCTKDSCNALTGACEHVYDASVAGCCNTSVYAEGFETDAPKWTFDAGANGIFWNSWEPKESSYTVGGKKVLKMGLNGDAKMAKLNSTFTYQFATSVPFAVPSGVASTLQFQYRFDLGASSSHALYVYLQDENGVTTFIKTTSGTNVKSWQKFTYDLSGFGGRTVRLRLRGRIHGPYAVGHGILIDELAVTSICKPNTCTKPSECPTKFACYKGACTAGKCVYTDTCCTSPLSCDDGKPCTFDGCNNSLGCTHSTVGNCCATAKDDATKLCNDKNSCTADLCPSSGGGCIHNEIKGCCLQDGDCDDGKGCTVDSCDQTKNTCTFKDTCCTTDKQCDDGDNKCSIDKCVAGKCAYTYATTAGCCIPTIGPYNFNAASQATGWTLGTCVPSSVAYLPTNCQSKNLPTSGKGWQVRTVSPHSASAKGALYYGDPVANNFNFGKSAQTARSPVMKVQPGVSTLKFKVYFDTESGSNYDRLIAFLWVDGQRISTGSTAPAAGGAWYKGQSGFTQPKTWLDVKIDVSKYAGKSLQVEFYFNSVDATNNSGQGVFIDDLRLDSTCK